MRRLQVLDTIRQIQSRPDYYAVTNTNYCLTAGQDKPGYDHKIFHTGENALDYILPQYHPMFLRLLRQKNGVYYFEYEFKNKNEVYPVRSLIEKTDNTIFCNGIYK